MVKWIVLASLLVASTAHANELATDGGPTTSLLAVDPLLLSPTIVDRGPPRMRSLGFRFGMANTQVDGHDRTLMTFGMQGAIEIIERRMRAVLDYEWLMMLGTDDAMESTRGRGHGLRAGLRLTLVDKTVRHDGRVHDNGRVYIDAESAVGAAYLTDSELGTTVLPNVIVGARLGFELYPQGEPSQSKLFDAHVMFRALVTRGDVGFVFGIGMEWGR